MFYPLHHISTEELPQRFTYPFHYEAHPLCVMAADKLQNELQNSTWQAPKQGKMFGVLIVKNKQGELGYLWAYSGNIVEGLNPTLFVPPIFDLLATNSFFKQGEAVLTAINHQIQTLEQAPEYLALKQKITEAQNHSAKEIAQQKDTIKNAKLHRQHQRLEAQRTLTEKEYKHLENQLIRESQQEKIKLKKNGKKWEEQIALLHQKILAKQAPIEALKHERKLKSNALQQALFDQYQLLNQHGEIKSLCTIFNEGMALMPPAGAGDCAAPRLLQYAYQQQMQALAMAEFWWGKSPATVIRKQGEYYPACKGKCAPILGHMLQGLEVEKNPLSHNEDLHVSITYEDESLIVIDKPSGMLSAPGKEESRDVIADLKAQRPDLKSIFTVHRLDMATSGLMIIAKSESIHKTLQAQFINRQVKKRYEAIVEGVLQEDTGKITLPLRIDLDNRPQQQVCYTHGKAAITQWTVLERKDTQTRVAFFPITGRTHQLRVHAAHPDGLNAPIVGDELYGHKRDRLLLHACQIIFKHPLNGKKMIIKSRPNF